MALATASRRGGEQREDVVNELGQIDAVKEQLKNRYKKLQQDGDNAQQTQETTRTPTAQRQRAQRMAESLARTTDPVTSEPAKLHFLQTVEIPQNEQWIEVGDRKEQEQQTTPHTWKLATRNTFYLLQDEEEAQPVK